MSNTKQADSGLFSVALQAPCSGRASEEAGNAPAHRGELRRSSQAPKMDLPDDRRLRPGMASRGVADLYGHLFAEHGKGGLDLFGPCGVPRVEHAADNALVNAQAAGQL